MSLAASNTKSLITSIAQKVQAVAKSKATATTIAKPVVNTSIFKPAVVSTTVVNKLAQTVNTTVQPKPVTQASIFKPVVISTSIVNKPVQTVNTTVQPKPVTQASILKPAVVSTPVVNKPVQKANTVAKQEQSKLTLVTKPSTKESVTTIPKTNNKVISKANTIANNPVVAPSIFKKSAIVNTVVATPEVSKSIFEPATTTTIEKGFNDAVKYNYPPEPIDNEVIPERVISKVSKPESGQTNSSNATTIIPVMKYAGLALLAFVSYRFVQSRIA